MIVNTDDEGSAQLDHFKIYSRKEAIKRMEKAIKENEGWGPKDLAEAALDALLGVEK